MFRTGAALTLIALAGFALASPANAQANCAEYGRLAIKQQKQNVTLKCGFTGNAWNPNLKAHMNWCQSVGPDKWKEQLQQRTQALKECKKK